MGAWQQGRERHLAAAAVFAATLFSHSWLLIGFWLRCSRSPRFSGSDFPRCVAATDGTPVTTNNNNADADDDDDCSGEFEVMLAASYQKRGISIWQRGSGLLKGAVLYHWA